MERAGRLFGKLKLSPEVADPETRVRAAWAVAVGPKVARRTRPTNLVRDSLVVEVEDFVWQQQLSRLEHFLISNLARELGEVLVKKIDFRPMPKRREPQRAQSARPGGEQIQDPVLNVVYRQSVYRQSKKR
jgi:predicted nucleic acid-binding Zn ribbon protein